MGQPGASDRVQRKLGTVGVDQDIRVDCNHDTARRCSTRSRYSSTAALLSMSTLGIRLPWVTGRSSRNSAGAGSASILRRASEISAVSVTPIRRARSRADCIRASSRLSVVFTAQPYTLCQISHISNPLARTRPDAYLMGTSTPAGTVAVSEPMT